MTRRARALLAFLFMMPAAAAMADDDIIEIRVSGEVVRTGPGQSVEATSDGLIQVTITATGNVEWLKCVGTCTVDVTGVVNNLAVPGGRAIFKTETNEFTVSSDQQLMELEEAIRNMISRKKKEGERR